MEIGPRCLRPPALPFGLPVAGDVAPLHSSVGGYGE